MPGAGCSSPQWTLHTCHSRAPSPPHTHGTSLRGHAVLAAAPWCDRSFHRDSAASAGRAAREGQKHKAREQQGEHRPKTGVRAHPHQPAEKHQQVSILPAINPSLCHKR